MPVASGRRKMHCRMHGGAAGSGAPKGVVPHANAPVLLDQAGWRVSRRLPVPSNITLVPLPPKSPESKVDCWQSLAEKSSDQIIDLAA
jgi:hypothetical protein